MERGGTVTLTDGPNKGDSVYDPDYRPLVYAKDIKSTVLRCAPRQHSANPAALRFHGPMTYLRPEADMSLLDASGITLC